MRRESAIVSVLALAIGLIACGDESSTSTAPTDGVVPTTDVTVPSTDTPGTSVPVTAPATSTPGTGAPEPSTPATTNPDEPFPLDVDFPTGTFHAAPGDMIVLGIDGDLAYHPRLFGTVRDAPIDLVDNPDPFGPVNEGPGPNVVDHVAGIVDGAVVFGECCEPISGVLLATTGIDEQTTLGFGYTPNLAPDGGAMVTANDQSLAVIETPGGAGTAVMLDQSPTEPYRNVVDVDWLDDEHVALLWRSDERWAISVIDASTLDELSVHELDTIEPGDSAAFAGRDGDGALMLAVHGADRVEVHRLGAPDPLAGVSTFGDEPAYVLPATVTSVRSEPGGIGLVWVDGSTLYALPTGADVADRLLDGVLAAWFVTEA